MASFSSSSAKEREELQGDIAQIRRALLADGNSALLEGGSASEVEDEENEDALYIDEVNVQSVDNFLGDGLTYEHEDSGATEADGDEAYDSGREEDGQGDVWSLYANVMTKCSQMNSESCLELNQAYQNIIRQSIGHIDVLIEDNISQQLSMQDQLAHLAEEKANRSAGPRRKHTILYAIPYFKDANGMHPPANRDTLTKRRNDELSPFVIPPKPWSDAEREVLTDAVNDDKLAKVLRPLMTKKEIYLEKYSALTLGSTDREPLLEKIHQLDDEIKRIQESKESAVKECAVEVQNIDWLKISSLDFLGKRTATACMLMWRNAAQPDIYTGRWSAEEDEMLQTSVTKHGGHDWQAIAAEMTTHRSAFQCIQRYQTSLNPCLTTGKWSPDEDKFLLEVVESCRDSHKILWDQVAYFMEGRVREQCLKRWRQLKASHNTSKWSKEEDFRLLEAVKRFGIHAWSKMAFILPNRTKSQCRERWYNSLDSSLKMGNWTYEEDRYVWLTVQEIGEGHWAAVAAKLEGRTDNMILHRYHRMLRWKQYAELKEKERQLRNLRQVDDDDGDGVEHNEDGDDGPDKDLPQNVNPAEKQQLQDDIAIGIRVPRPPRFGLDIRCVKKQQERLELHKIIDRYISQKKCTPLDDDAIWRILGKKKEKKNDSDDTKPSLMASSSVSEIVEASKRLVTKSDKRHLGCSKMSPEEQHLEEQLKWVVGNQMPKRARGRPKKGEAGMHNADNPLRMDTDGNVSVKAETARILFDALNADQQTMSKRAHSEKKNASKKENPKESLLPSDVGVQSSVDLWCSLVTDTWGKLSSVRKVEHLPPNCATMNAFRRLLSRRQCLEEIAGDLYQGSEAVSDDAKAASKTQWYKTFACRMRSAFLWPALLSAVSPEEQTTTESAEQNPTTDTSAPTQQNETTSPTQTGYAKRKKYACTRGKRYRKYLLKGKKEKNKFEAGCSENAFNAHRRSQETGEEVKPKRVVKRCRPNEENIRHSQRLKTNAATKQAKRCKTESVLSTDCQPSNDTPTTSIAQTLNQQLLPHTSTQLVHPTSMVELSTASVPVITDTNVVLQTLTLAPTQCDTLPVIIIAPDHQVVMTDSVRPQ